MTFQHHPTVQELFDRGAPVTPFLRGPLNQWHRAHFSIDGTEFNCAEQYMMYRKAQMFGDARMAAKILEATKPFDHKRMGQQVQNFDQDAWVEARVEIVVTGNRAKFGQNDGLAKKLLRTDGTILAEVNPRDKIWGHRFGRSRLWRSGPGAVARAQPPRLDPDGGQARAG